MRCGLDSSPKTMPSNSGSGTKSPTGRSRQSTVTMDPLVGHCEEGDEEDADDAPVEPSICSGCDNEEETDRTTGELLLPLLRPARDRGDRNPIPNFSFATDAFNANASAERKQQEVINRRHPAIAFCIPSFFVSVVIVDVIDVLGFVDGLDVADMIDCLPLIFNSSIANASDSALC